MRNARAPGHIHCSKTSAGRRVPLHSHIARWTCKRTGGEGAGSGREERGEREKVGTRLHTILINGFVPLCWTALQQVVHCAGRRGVGPIRRPNGPRMRGLLGLHKLGGTISLLAPVTRVQAGRRRRTRRETRREEVWVLARRGECKSLTRARSAPTASRPGPGETESQDRW